MINYRSYTHNLSSCKIEDWKNFFLGIKAWKNSFQSNFTTA